MHADRFTIGVTEAVADAKNCDPMEIGYRLGEHVNMEAIDRLAESNTNWALSFDLPDHTITITRENEIVVDGIGAD